MLGMVFGILILSCGSSTKRPTPSAALHESESSATSLLPEALTEIGTWYPTPNQLIQVWNSNVQTQSVEFQEAFVFLLTQVRYHYTEYYHVVSETGERLPHPFDPYLDTESIQALWNAMQEEYGAIRFARSKIERDVNTVSLSELVDTIHLALEVRHTVPWASAYSWAIFLDYILPYRVSQEPVDSWRHFFMDRFHSYITPPFPYHKIQDVAQVINQAISRIFIFDPGYHFHPTDQSFTQMLERKAGRCEDMTNFATYALRSVGIAATSDYVPFWGHAGNNHAWNVILFPSGGTQAFMGCDGSMDPPFLPKLIPKVYRKTFHTHLPPSLIKAVLATPLPRQLRFLHYLDVTSEYTHTTRICVTLNNPLSQGDMLLLTVFNNGTWQPVSAQYITETMHHICFNKVGTGLVYLIQAIRAFHPSNPFQGGNPIRSPFHLDRTGQMYWFNGDTGGSDNKTTNPLTSLVIRSVDFRGEYALNKPLKKGRCYRLYRWNQGWEIIRTITISEAHWIEDQEQYGVELSELKAGWLYWMVEEGGAGDERIFSINDEEWVWW